MKSLMTVDIAHPPMRSEEAERLLDESLRKIRLSSHLRIMKIIHGYGSKGTGGALKTVVKNWVHQHHDNIISSIDGEQLTPFNPQVQVLSAECNMSPEKDLGAPNEGITIVWVS